ncbi:MAG TPA: ATP-binding protein [Chthonomonadaceae bacterium]|nr:ATP-binding protein [Chthonomonadaceae bacterium]
MGHMRPSTLALHPNAVALTHILNICMDAIIAIDADQRIQLFNRGAEQIFEYQAAEVLGQPLDLLLPPSCAKPHRAFVQAFGLAPESTRLMGRRHEVSGRRKSGAVFPAEATISKWTEGGRQVFAVILRDVSDRKAMEAQFLQAQKMESVGRLAGGIAHDFNNLLTAILGYTALAEDSLPDEEATQSCLSRIREAAERAANLTGQLMTFSRKQTITPQVINLNELILGLENILQRLIGEHIEVIVRTQEGLGQVRVDPVQMEQVLINLAVNARDAMPQGGKLRIETANATVEEAQGYGVRPGKCVHLLVRDTGVGLTEKVKVHLFEPFFTTKSPGKGTGLGLAICYNIVKQNDGDIQVESQAGQGTTFHIYLPCEEDGVAMPLEETPDALPRGAETIFLVEDEPLVRDMAARALRKQGYRVIEAASGAEALQKADAYPGPISLLLTDVIMPNMSGKELAERLRAEGKVTKVLYASGYTDNIIMREGMLEPGVILLPKPFSPARLIRTVRNVLDSKDDRSDGELLPGL